MDMDHQSSVNKAYVVKELKKFRFITLRNKIRNLKVIRDNNFDDQKDNKVGFINRYLSNKNKLLNCI